MTRVCSWCRTAQPIVHVRVGRRGASRVACLACFRAAFGRDPGEEEPLYDPASPRVGRRPLAPRPPDHPDGPRLPIEHRKQPGPGSEKLARALELIDGGATVSQAAAEVGLRNPTVEKGWMRWRVLPEWRKWSAIRRALGEIDAADSGRSVLDRAVVRIGELQKTVLELDAENQDLGARLADYMMQPELDAIAASPEFDEPGASDCAHPEGAVA